MLFVQKQVHFWLFKYSFRYPVWTPREMSNEKYTYFEGFAEAYCGSGKERRRKKEEKKAQDFGLYVVRKSIDTSCYVYSRPI